MENRIIIPPSFYPNVAKVLRSESVVNDRCHALVACMPKSGSTFLTTLISSFPDFKVVALVNGWGRREQELDLLTTIFHHPANYVAQNHIRYSEQTAILMRTFNIKPIVLVRNLFDVVISIRDHWRNEGTTGPFAYANEKMQSWDNDRLEKFIATMVMPWYFNFFMCWTDCPEKLLLNYDEHIKGDISSTARQIAQHLGLDLTQEQLLMAVNVASQSHTRKNQAVIGRGNALSESTRELILNMASFYEGQDFSVLGIR